MSEATRDETEEAPSANFQPVKYKGVEVRSIDWVPEQERHGKLWHQAPLLFLGNFQYFTIAVGFVKGWILRGEATACVFDID